MSKTALFVVTCSAVILALFGLSCYLMSTVNPPLLVDHVPTKGPTKYGDNLASFYLRHMEPTDVLDYGMEKAHESSAPHSSPAPVRINFTSYIPTVKIKNPHLAKVYPPMWPKTTTKETKLITTNKATVKHKENITNGTKVESPIHRRSINVIEKNIDKNTGAVILKILDNDGKSRIEIKLNPNDMFEKKKSRPHRSFLKTDPTLNNNVEIINTEIKILPNDTVIINNNNDTRETIDFRTNIDINHKFSTNSETVDISKILYPIENSTAHIYEDNTTVKTKKVENQNKAVTKELLDVTELRTKIQMSKEIKFIPRTFTTTDVFGLKVMFDNVTRSFTEKYNEIMQNKTR